MEFSIDKIGKFVLRDAVDGIKVDSGNVTRKVEFMLVVGYDNLRCKFLATSITDSFNFYSAVPDYAQFFNLEEALHYIDKSIATSRARREWWSNNWKDKVYCDISKVNYQNELARLPRAYYESVKQLEYLRCYVNNAAYHDMYLREIKGTEKALRRLEKRFQFFFGENKEHMKQCIEAVGPTESETKLIRQLLYNEECMTRHKDSLKRAAARWETAQKRSD